MNWGKIADVASRTYLEQPLPRGLSQSDREYFNAVLNELQSVARGQWPRDREMALAGLRYLADARSEEPTE